MNCLFGDLVFETPRRCLIDLHVDPDLSISFGLLIDYFTELTSRIGQLGQQPPTGVAFGFGGLESYDILVLLEIARKELQRDKGSAHVFVGHREPARIPQFGRNYASLANIVEAKYKSIHCDMIVGPIPEFDNTPEEYYCTIRDVTFADVAPDETDVVIRSLRI
ncbi:hypothetical protein Aduo_007812 [Ancylostoma duodenale]